MKKLFYIGLVGLALLEILNVYFIMPMPGSQQMDTVELAYFIHSSRWYFRVLFGIFIFIGAKETFGSKKKWIPLVALLFLFIICYAFNFQMTAEKMFSEPEKLSFYNSQHHQENDSSLVIAVTQGEEAKAYPVRYIVYHHQVRDSIAGKPIMVTYCSVCRTGRVFEPLVNGHVEKFRLVGMDHFNAMFEDSATRSWWQQSTGKAITGPLKGSELPEMRSTQMTVGKFFKLFPTGLVMQADSASLSKYDSLGRFEKGRSQSKLTGTDSLSWKEKSWVVGISQNGKSKAYDWNDLKSERIIHDTIGGQPILLALSVDGQSFAAFKRDSIQHLFSFKQDTLYSGEGVFDFKGKSTSSDMEDLKQINAYQEFWHSWRTFQPNTETYTPKSKN